MNKQWQTKLYDGKVGNTNYDYAPSVHISEDGYSIANVGLVSVGYSGDQEARERSEMNARRISVTPELEAFLTTILSIPAVQDISDRINKSGQNNPIADAQAILDFIRKGE